jgi:hypothetical protein
VVVVFRWWFLVVLDMLEVRVDPILFADSGGEYAEEN